MRLSGGVLRALDNPTFRNLWLASLGSNLGYWMQSVAIGWTVVRATSAPEALGIITFVSMAPLVLLGPLAGAIADRLSRVILLRGAQLVLSFNAALLAALSLLGWLQVWMIAAIGSVSGAAAAFGQPAGQALMPRLVDRAALPNAIALNSIQFNLSRILGPAVAGWAIAGVGAGACFAANAVSYWAPIWALKDVRDRPGRPVQGPRLRASIRSGLRYAWADPMVRPLMMASLVFCFFVLPQQSYVPWFATHRLGLGAGGLGNLLGVGGAGALIGALFNAWRTVQGTKLDARPTIAVAAVASIVFCATTNPIVAGVAEFVLGAAAVATAAGLGSRLQLVTREHLRGRVLGLHASLWVGAIACGGLLVSALAPLIGAPWALVAMNAAALGFVAHAFWRTGN